MRVKPCLPTLLFAVAVTACGAPPAPAHAPAPATAPATTTAPAPAPPAAAAPSEAEANAAYDAQRWAECARLYEALAATRQGRAREHAVYNAACCHARDGKPDPAFALLDAAVQGGMRDVAHLRGDPDLASLHADPRWARIAAGVERNVKTSRPGSATRRCGASCSRSPTRTSARASRTSRSRTTPPCATRSRRSIARRRRG